MKPGDKITYLNYGVQKTGTVINVGTSGIIFVRSDDTGILNFLFPDSVINIEGV